MLLINSFSKILLVFIHLSELKQRTFVENSDKVIFSFSADESSVPYPTLRFSPIWNYYDRIHNNMATCKVCNKTLKGAQTSQAEYHLRAKHPVEALTFLQQKAQWLERKKKMNVFYIAGMELA